MQLPYVPCAAPFPFVIASCSLAISVCSFSESHCAFVGVNAVFEMLSSTVITGAVGSVLLKAGFIQTPAKKAD